MKIKVLLLAFAQLLMFSLTSHSEENVMMVIFGTSGLKKVNSSGLGIFPRKIK